MAVCPLFSAMVDLPYIDMTSIHLMNVGRFVAVAVAVTWFATARNADGCGAPGDWHIEVTTDFAVEHERNDYMLADIAALARRQLQLGQVAYLSLVNAENANAQARLALVQAQAFRLADTAALFQALGGGWWNRAELQTADNAGGAGMR